MFPDILQNAENMNKSCTIKDIQVIAKVLELHTGCSWYNYKERKHVNINMLVQAFAGSNFLVVKDRTATKTHSVKSLQYITKEYIKRDCYPLICLQAAYANALLKKLKHERDIHCRIELLGYIPSMESRNKVFRCQRTS